MDEISIKNLSKGVLAKIRKGLPVRIQDGDDLKIKIDKKKMKKVLNSFQKDKAITISLDDLELQQNQTMKGSGIFSDKVDKYLKVARNVLKTAGKPYEANVGFNPSELGYDLGYNYIAPALDNAGLLPSLSGKGLYGGGLYGGGLYGGGMFGLYGKTVNQRRNEILKSKGSGLYAQPQMRGSGNKRLLDQQFSVREGVNFFGKELPKSISGGALQRNRRDLLIEKGSVGVGGNLITKYEQSPAMRSQPFSVNFQSQANLPPFYKQFHNGLN